MIEREDFELVRVFHEKFGLPTQGRRPPEAISSELVDFRLKFLLEELLELAEAYGRTLVVDAPLDGGGLRFIKTEASNEQDLPAAADALVDLVYVALGTAHLHSFPWRRLFDEVQYANMQKVRALPHAYEECPVPAWECELHKPQEEFCHHEGRQTMTLADICGAKKRYHSARGSSSDVVKPEGWQPPDIASVLRYYGLEV